MSNNSFHIFCIAHNCGEIAKKAIESFRKYHSDEVTIYCTPKDFKSLKHIENINFFETVSDSAVSNSYQHGHMGTAYVWAKLISKQWQDCQYLIQFDSDVVFLENCIDEIKNKLLNGYDLIGPRRSYKNNPHNNPQYEEFQDVLSTYLIGINVNKVTQRDFHTMQMMCGGFQNPLGHVVIDFFDPVSFDILHNGGKIFYLDKETYGSTDENGKKENSHGKMNLMMDYGSKIAHFAGIGSGMSFFNNGGGTVPQGYIDWSLKRYAMYVKLFYNRDLYNPDVTKIEFDEEFYNECKKYFKN